MGPDKEVCRTVFIFCIKQRSEFQQNDLGILIPTRVTEIQKTYHLLKQIMLLDPAKRSKEVSAMIGSSHSNVIKVHTKGANNLQSLHVALSAMTHNPCPIPS